MTRSRLHHIWSQAHAITSGSSSENPWIGGTSSSSEHKRIILARIFTWFFFIKISFSLYYAFYLIVKSDTFVLRVYTFISLTLQSKGSFPFFFVFREDSQTFKSNTQRQPDLERTHLLIIHILVIRGDRTHTSRKVAF